ncbi:hypothetical protein SDC9_96283 [bioreactor metagenome]|uniref:Uncharacterized protein n=1 Tax=bioreactor metagenome TaxID=1076179 RepID=A0A645AFE1_9ZZZZ
MAGLSQDDGPVPPNLRPDAVQLIGKLASGENQVQMDQRVVVPLDVLPVICRVGGQLRKDTLDLLLFLGLQLNVLVVGLYHPHGLHEKRCPGGGYVVDKARQSPPLLRLHRHHEPPVPLSDDALLQDLAVRRGGYDALENLAAFRLRRPHFPANIVQLGACIVGDGVLVQNDGLNFVLQETVAVER